MPSSVSPEGCIPSGRYSAPTSPLSLITHSSCRGRCQKVFQERLCSALEERFLLGQPPSATPSHWNSHPASAGDGGTGLSHRDQAQPPQRGPPCSPGQGPPSFWGIQEHGAAGGAGSCPHSCPDRWFPTQQQSPAGLMCPWAAGHHRSHPGTGTGHPAPGTAPRGHRGDHPRAEGKGRLTRGSAWGCPGRRRQRCAAAPSGRWCWKEGRAEHLRCASRISLLGAAPVTPCSGIGPWGFPPSPALPSLRFPVQGPHPRAAHRFLRSRSVLVSARVRVVSAGWFSMMLEGREGSGWQPTTPRARGCWQSVGRGA